MYSTLDDLKKILPEARLLQLADDEDAGSFVESPANAAYTRVVEAIESSDQIIDGYVSGRYDLPFATTPPLINQISAHLAICQLYMRWQDQEIPAGIKDRQKQYLGILSKIQKNEMSIPDFDPLPPSEYLVSKTTDDFEFPDTILDQM